MIETLAAERTASRRIAAGVVAVLMLAAALLAGLVLIDRGHHRHVAEETIDHLSRDLQRDLVERLRGADEVLQAASAAHRRLGVGPLGRSDAFDAELHDLQDHLPPGTDLRAANRAGLVVHGPRADPARPFDVSQRQFFIEASANPERVISVPLKSRISQRWVLPMALGLRDATGRPAGVVYVNLPFDDIGALFAAQPVGRRGVVTLFNSERQVLLRHPPHPSMQDERPLRLSSPETLAALQHKVASARFTTHSSVDQVQRIAMLRELAPYPLYVLVALATDDVYASWYAQVALALGFWCVLAAAGVALLVHLSRAQRWRAAMWTGLDTARREADRASAAKSRFLARMGHELRTPLNGVLGFAQMGQRDAARPAEARRNFARILDAGRLLQGLLSDVLDLARLDAGQLELHPEPVRVRSAVRHAVELMATPARDKGLDLRLTVDARVPEQVLVDPLRVGQVLLHLLSNAVKFTNTGHVGLSVDVVDNHLLLIVADSGPGIAAPDVERLFQPFEQGDPAIARRLGGSGLGLTIARRLVHCMDGTLSVSSRTGAGSVFTVRLPLVVPPDDASAAEVPATVAAAVQGPTPRSRLDGLRVLVAEDNAINQIVIQGLLELEGASAEVVPDGQQAVARVAAQDGTPYHVALLDLMMPGIDGYETARRIRAVDPGLPMIGQTAHAMQEDRAHCIEAGMVDRVTKPIDTEELVRSVLRHARRD